MCHIPIQALVLSSYCIRNGHIMCLFYLTRCLSSLLDIHFVSMDPRNYFQLEKNGFILPEKCLRHLPPVLLKICKLCKCYSEKRCVCVRNLLEAAQDLVVAVKNVKIFTTLWPDDSSSVSNRLLFAHISNSKQISPYFLLK